MDFEDFERQQKNILSPILELSDGDISAALEQMSEYTGDVTDRNIEDILQEAEDLLQSSNDTSYRENKSKTCISEYKQLVDEIKKSKQERTIQTPVKLNLEQNKLTYDREILRDSANHIKFTLDSLNDKITGHMENKMSSPKSDTSNKSKKNENKITKEPCKRLKSASSHAQEMKCNNPPTGKFKPVACNYRAEEDNHKTDAPKSDDDLDEAKSTDDIGVIDKKEYEILQILGSAGVKKMVQEIDENHTTARSQEEIKSHVSTKQHTSAMSDEDKSHQNLNNSELESLKNELAAQEALLKTYEKENSKLCLVVKEANMKLKNTEEKLTKVSGKQTDDSLIDQLRDKEETIVKLEMKIDELKSVANSNGDNGDKRLAMLERQFELLKAKYEDKINKLEIRNKHLSRTSLSDVLALGQSATSSCSQTSLPDFSKLPDTSATSSASISVTSARARSAPAPTKSNKLVKKLPPKIVTKKVENHDVETTKLRKQEISVECQTEKMRTDVSVQTKVEKASDKLVQTDAKDEMKQVREVSVQTDEETNNKYNPEQQKKLKNKNVTEDSHADKMKKLSEHETHLMATLRGTQNELAQKDKENKRLRVELESAKSQIKKFQNLSKCLDKKKGSDTVAVVLKKNTIGSQTIGLDLPMHYDPDLFQVSDNLEVENKELRDKCQELEMNLERLKIKRTNDLRMLQDTHEDEIAKLESQLQTRTALAKHLHSLLTTR